jgi:proteasome lid subunit RPN8/RPN11
VIEVALDLNPRLEEKLLAHFRACRPNEGCALLIGTPGGPVSEILRTTNIDQSPTSYTVDSNQVLAAHDRAEAAGLAVIGVAHSHPNGPAEPSTTDVDKALDPNWLYVIVGADETLKTYRLKRPNTGVPAQGR